MVLHINCLWIFLKHLILYNILTSQHITVHGHLLDYIITRKDSSGVSNVYISEFICDHRALQVSLTCNRVHPERKHINVRSLKRIT